MSWKYKLKYDLNAHLETSIYSGRRTDVKERDMAPDWNPPDAIQGRTLIYSVGNWKTVL